MGIFWQICNTTVPTPLPYKNLPLTPPPPHPLTPPHRQEHSEGCDYRDAQCTQCGQYVQQLSLKEHQEGDCPMRPAPCQYCKSDVPSQQMQVSTVEPLTNHYLPENETIFANC